MVMTKKVITYNTQNNMCQAYLRSSSLSDSSRSVLSAFKVSCRCSKSDSSALSSMLSPFAFSISVSAADSASSAVSLSRRMASELLSLSKRSVSSWYVIVLRRLDSSSLSSLTVCRPEISSCREHLDTCHQKEILTTVSSKMCTSSLPPWGPPTVQNHHNS